MRKNIQFTRLFIFFTLFFIGIDAFAQSGTEYTGFEKPERGFAISHPSHWVTEEQEFPEMYFFEAVEQDTGVNINMTVASDQGAPFPDWYAMIENELNNEPGAEVLYSGVLELGVHQCSVFMAVRNNGSYAFNRINRIVPPSAL